MVTHYDDLIKYGSEKAVKEAGRLREEGKEYIVQDGYNGISIQRLIIEKVQIKRLEQQFQPFDVLKEGNMVKIYDRWLGESRYKVFKWSKHTIGFMAIDFQL